MSTSSETAAAKMLQIALLIYACVGGTDFLITPHKHSLYSTELQLPVIPLGVAFLTLGITGLVGLRWQEICRDYRLSPAAPWLCRVVLENPGWSTFGAHVGLFGMYLGLGLAAFAEQIANTHFYGGGVTAGMFLLATAHWWHARGSFRDV